METRRHIEWGILFDGEPMGSHVTGFEDARALIARSPHPASRYAIVMREVSTRTSPWRRIDTEWQGVPEGEEVVEHYG